MSYLVLARKYRPQSFEDVVGQEHVTRTLQNAIAAGRVAHAILFSGPRGTGKTTVARIMAKAMNCATGPTPRPCNQCRSCSEIRDGGAADVYEIDGASNNGVDHIRDLRENVKYMPAHSPRKIYIIDEVHMLSAAAFNALLKTLEEPPDHVMFFFATTEIHKIPVTILSRCQRHDMRRINVDAIVSHMESLCRRENVTVSPESLRVIAREAEGGMRDALSLLDQIITCADEDGAIAHEKVIDLLGVVDRRALFDMSGAIVAGDVPRMLEIIEAIHRHGHNLKTFYADLAAHFRNLLVVRMGREVDRLVDAPAHEREQMAAQTRDLSPEYLCRMATALLAEEPALKFSASPRIAMEMALIRLVHIRPILPIETLIDALDRLRDGVEPPEPAPQRPLMTRRADLAPEPETARQPNLNQAREWEHSPGQAAMPDAKPAMPDAKPAPEPPVETSPPLPAHAHPADWNQEDERPIEEKPADENPYDAVARTDAPPPLEFDASEDKEKIWRKFVARAETLSTPLGARLGKCELAALSDDRMEIALDGNNMSRNQIEKGMDKLKEACRLHFGHEMTIQLREAEGNGSEASSRRERMDAIEGAQQKARSHPVVTAAMEIFHGTFLKVELLD